MRPATPAAEVPVWDRFVRLAHWALAALIAYNLIEDSGGERHRLAGYGAVAVVALRLVWGLVSHGHASLVHPRPSVRAALIHVNKLRLGRAGRHLGHNPLGVWMMWFLWALVLALGLTGWMSRLDRYWGEDRLTDLHAFLAKVLMGAIAVHLAGVALMSVLQRENLVRAMLTGRKRRGGPPRAT